MTIAIFENSTTHKDTKVFSGPLKSIIAFNKNELIKSLNEIDIQRKRGYYLAGYISYDAIFYLNDKLNHLRPITSLSPLVHFEVFSKLDNHIPENITNPLDKNPLRINFLAISDDYNSYNNKFNQVIKNLELGNSYQINLTSDVKIETTDNDLLNLYYKLTRSHPVPYAAYLNYSPISIASISPELFFKKSGNKIMVKPMKGTYQRGLSGDEDKINYNTLKNDEKNISENLIIVDLLRNDLAKIAETGSVNATKLFDVETYNSVFQMTSTIEANITMETSFLEIVKALFPCGSITGAPKLKTIELIEEIEDYNRNVYTGAIGYIMPNNDMLFNVAIRTISKKNNSLSIAVGGGITINSQAQEEYEEMKTKLNFVKKFYKPDFELIESLLYSQGDYRNLTDHIDRISSSSQKLFFSCNSNKIYYILKEYSSQLENDKNYKVRIALSYKGNFEISHTEIGRNPEIINLGVLAQNIDSSHELFKHKTTSKYTRKIYDELHEKYKAEHIDEILFINNKNHITESRYHNLIVVIDNQWITPPIDDGLLAGIYRKKLIEAGKLIEQHITLDTMKSAQEVYLCNDVRGLIKCNLMGKI